MSDILEIGGDIYSDNTKSSQVSGASLIGGNSAAAMMLKKEFDLRLYKYWKNY